MFFFKHFLANPDDPIVSSEIDDIRRNLRWILETRRGTGYFLPTFGMSDLGSWSPAQRVTEMRRELMENVRLYEPRLELIDVEEDLDDEGNRSKLALRARLRSTGAPFHVDVDLTKRAFRIEGEDPDGIE